MMWLLLQLKLSVEISIHLSSRSGDQLELKIVTYHVSLKVEVCGDLEQVFAQLVYILKKGG